MMIPARYTEVLKNLMDNDRIRPSIDKALSTYPIYIPQSTNENVLSCIPTREQLNNKILNAYKYREIGFDTVGRFLDELEISMCEIMPYYNQMFHTVETMNDIEDIFGNVDVTETYKETREGKSEGKGASESNSSNTTKSTMKNDDKKVHSDTPQDTINIPSKNIEDVLYANDVEWNKNNADSEGESSGTSSSSGTSESTETVKTQHEFHKKGNQGVNTYAHDMLEFRQTILNIEQQIINDERISELFMRVF